uniref:Uncharacterized protein n=1 Tax=Zea mays TaxID=4577 RepID=A0A804PTN5_MAIZE
MLATTMRSSYLKMDSAVQPLWTASKGRLRRSLPNTATVGQTGYAQGDFVSTEKPGATLPTGTAAPSPEARQTRSPRA